MEKAEGEDGIPAELLKNLAQNAKGSYDICNEIYVSGKWPDDFFYSRDAMRKRGLCCRNMSVWMYVCHTPVLCLKG